jgi:hypothetical protein
MNFKTKAKLLLENPIQNLSLSIGKYKLFQDCPRELFSYPAAPLHAQTRLNCEDIKAHRAKFGENIEWVNVYKIKKNGSSKNSFYIVGTLNNKPIVYARIPSPNGVGNTKIYLENGYMDKNTFACIRPLENGGWRAGCCYYKDYFAKKLHRLDGPAIDYGPDYIGNQYWIDGKRIPNDIFHAMQKVNTPEDKESMTDLLNI